MNIAKKVLKIASEQRDHEKLRIAVLNRIANPAENELEEFKELENLCNDIDVSNIAFTLFEKKRDRSVKLDLSKTDPMIVISAFVRCLKSDKNLLRGA